MEAPIKIVNKETKLFGLELRKGETIEGLNGFVITENNKLVFAVQLQLVELCASLCWPKIGFPSSILRRNVPAQSTESGPAPRIPFDGTGIDAIQTDPVSACDANVGDTSVTAIIVAMIDFI